MFYYPTEVTSINQFSINGKQESMYLSTGLSNHQTARINLLTMDWKFTPVQRTGYLRDEELSRKPMHYEDIVHVAEASSMGIPFGHMYMDEIGRRIYFSELEFTPCGGGMPVDPAGWDEKVGELLTLPYKICSINKS